jgi:hypothetical protein
MVDQLAMEGISPLLAESLGPMVDQAVEAVVS